MVYDTRLEKRPASSVRLVHRLEPISDSNAVVWFSTEEMESWTLADWMCVCVCVRVASKS